MLSSFGTSSPSGSRHAAPGSGLPLLLDVFPVNDEIAMVRYRLELHARWPGTTRTIIAESSVTHTGHPKRRFVREAMPPGELERHNVRLVDVHSPRLS